MQTTHLSLPLLAAAQAQKHVTHNEALLHLDALVQLAVESRAQTLPPASLEGQRWIVPAAGPHTGAWAGREGQVAFRQSDAWRFFTPQEGWTAFARDEGAMLVFSSGAWRALSPPPVQLDRLGINGAADAVNRLTARAQSILLADDPAGPGDVRLAVSRRDAGSVASVVFQTNYSGRAELGLAGENAFSLRMSTNGSAFATALRVNPQGFLGLGDVSPERMFHVRGANAIWRLDRDAGTAGMQLHRYASGFSSPPLRGFLLGVNATDATSGSFIIADYGAAVAGANVTRLEINEQGQILPGADNAQTLGAPSRRFSTIYAATGVINASDERLKIDVAPCPLGLDFIKALRPCAYRWREGGRAAPAPEREAPEPPAQTSKTGRRLHLGLIAQEVRAALEAAGEDCALWVSDDPDDPTALQSLRYDQLIAPLIRAVQDLSNRLERLEAHAPT